eukprot:314351-Alexandrium_andersonii.AAC.1
MWERSGVGRVVWLALVVVGGGIGMPMLCVRSCCSMWWSLSCMVAVKGRSPRGSPGGVPVA